MTLKQKNSKDKYFDTQVIKLFFKGVDPFADELDLHVLVYFDYIIYYMRCFLKLNDMLIICWKIS